MIEEINEGRKIYDQRCRMWGGKKTREAVHEMLKERGDPRRPKAGEIFVAGTLSLDVVPNRKQRKVLTEQSRNIYNELFEAKNIHVVYLGFRKQRTDNASK